MYRADDSEHLRVFLHNKGIEFEALTESSPDDPDSFKREQLEAVKRWFYDDWRRIEPKLRTSIVEGISVFLSLFDDNPARQAHLLPTGEMLRSCCQRGWQIRQAAAFVPMAHRKRQSLRSEFPHRNEPRTWPAPSAS